MPNNDPDQEELTEEQVEQTLAQKVAVLQDRMREMGVVSEGSDDKAFMDEGWSKESGDAQKL